MQRVSQASDLGDFAGPGRNFEISSPFVGAGRAKLLIETLARKRSDQVLLSAIFVPPWKLFLSVVLVSFELLQNLLPLNVFPTTFTVAINMRLMLTFHRVVQSLLEHQPLLLSCNQLYARVPCCLLYCLHQNTRTNQKVFDVHFLQGNLL
jgi:hypothetical protein